MYTHDLYICSLLHYRGYHRLYMSNRTTASGGRQISLHCFHFHRMRGCCGPSGILRRYSLAAKQPATAESSAGSPYPVKQPQPDRSVTRACKPLSPPPPPHTHPWLISKPMAPPLNPSPIGSTLPIGSHATIDYRLLTAVAMLGALISLTISRSCSSVSISCSRAASLRTDSGGACVRDQ